MNERTKKKKKKREIAPFEYMAFFSVFFFLAGGKSNFYTNEPYGWIFVYEKYAQ